jgi:DnaJ-class molecular chaperone
MPRIVCPGCNGAGGNKKEVRSFERCNRRGGTGGKRSGKVWVPCSGCNGAGGKNKTSIIIENCRTCGGRKWVGG